MTTHTLPSKFNSETCHRSASGPTKSSASTHTGTGPPTFAVDEEGTVLVADGVVLDLGDVVRDVVHRVHLELFGAAHRCQHARHAAENGSSGGANAAVNGSTVRINGSADSTNGSAVSINRGKDLRRKTLAKAARAAYAMSERLMKAKLAAAYIASMYLQQVPSGQLLGTCKRLRKNRE
eukprot:1596777-Rhodomonas_salina.1